jgi:chromosome segregation ATPase
MVSLISPTYGRTWLSATHHPGDTVSSTQADGLVLEAERRLGKRPKRQTELLCKRIDDLEPHMMQIQERLDAQQKPIQHAQERLEKTQQQIQEQQTRMEALEKHYQERKREERPTSQLANPRHRIQMFARRLKCQETARLSADRRLGKAQAQWQGAQTERACLQERLKRFEQDNASNTEPIEAECRLDAGFGSYQNVA